MTLDVAKTRRETLRWTILKALDNNRPLETSESTLLTILASVYQDVTPTEVRRELDYLKDRELVVIRKEPTGAWWADITRYGTDIVEYTVECDPGIARPAKYW